MNRADDYRRESGELLRLALPIIAAQITFVGMGTVDTIMAGRLGGRELAAVAVGSNLWFLSFVFFMGLFMAMSPIVAQRLGAGRPDAETGNFVRGAMTAAIAVGVLWTLLVRFAAPPVVHVLGMDEVTTRFAVDYLRAVVWSAAPFSLCFVLRYTAEARGFPRAVLLAGLAGFSVNAFLDWVLMYGRLGFPALGPEGCGWATVVAGLVMVGVYLATFRFSRRLQSLQLLARRLQRPTAEHWEILRVGLPISVIWVAEVALFNLVAVLMARFGEIPVAAHQVAINFAALCFMVPMGLGLATTVRVGHAVGAGATADAALRGRVGIGLGFAFSLFSASAMALFPEAIVSVYTRDPDVTALAVTFLRYAALFQVFDCLQATASGALRGYKDTRVPMVITVIAYWGIGFPVAAGFAFGAGFGPTAMWWGLTAGLAAAAAGLCLRFFRRGF
jgi:multidrug resistance protein, MATE family